MTQKAYAFSSCKGRYKRNRTRTEANEPHTLSPPLIPTRAHEQCARRFMGTKCKGSHRGVVYSKGKPGITCISAKGAHTATGLRTNVSTRITN
jgi:hypothetical protein